MAFSEIKVRFLMVFKYRGSVSQKEISSGERLGYDRLSARSHINHAWSAVFPIWQNSTSGTVRLDNHLVHVNPYFGYRIPIQKIRLDLTAGFNLSSIRSSNYRVSMDETFPRKLDKKAQNGFINTKWDFGPVTGLAVHYKKFAASASYTYGLINYQRMMDGGNFEVYSRYLRVGVAYRLK
jgi:hypothetical protein